MAYGELKCDTITFTAGGVDTSVSISGLVQNPTFTGNITTTGTISGDIIRGNTVSGVTVTGGTGEFGNLTAVSGVFTTQVSGATVTGNVGLFTTITGGTVNLTSGVFASGTAAAPSVSIGTTDNGLYSPGADQVAISTNGTGRLFVDASGNVSVVGDISTTGGTGRLNIRGTASGVNNDLQIGNDDSFVYFRGSRSNAVSKGFIWYSDNSLSERLRITSDGKVGVGTSSPVSALHIEAAAGSSQLSIGNTALAVNANDLVAGINFFIKDNNDGTGATCGAVRAIASQAHTLAAKGTELAFYTTLDGTSTLSERVRIDDAGRVGIGTSSPDQLLDVAASTGATIQLKSTKTGAAVNDVLGTIAYYGSDGSGSGAGVKSSITSTAQGTGGAGSDLRFHTTNSAGSNNTEKVRIDEQGRVGIGTTSPSTALQVVGAISSSSSIYSTDGTRYALLGTDGSNPYLGTAGLAQAFVFKIGNGSTDVERARLDTSGRLLVGTSSARANFLNTTGTARLQVEGTDANNSVVSITRNSANTGGAFLYLNKTRGAAVGDNTIVQSGDTLGGVVFEGSDGSEFVAGAWILGEVDGTPGVDDMPGRLVFSTTADGASSPTERLRITSDGKVGVGTTSPGGILTVNESSTSAGDSYDILRLSSTSGGIFQIGIDDKTASNPTWRINTGGNEPLAFAQGGVNERARIDSSGRLLVGTTTSRNGGYADPAQVLIEGLNYNTAAQSIILNSNDVNGASLNFAKSRGTTLNSFTIVQSGDRIGVIDFAGADGSTLRRAAVIGAFVDGTPGANDMPGRLVFSTNPGSPATSPTERMRISANGILDTFGSSGVGVGIRNAQAAANNLYLLRGFYSATTTLNGTVSVQIATNGDITNTNNSYDAISDSKLKENIVDAGSQWSDIKSLQVRNYNFKEETGHQTHTQIGLIAQELELTSPGLVTTSPDLDDEGNDLGTVTKGVKYSVLYMKAVKALQEAMERIEVLEQRLTDAGIA